MNPYLDTAQEREEPSQVRAKRVPNEGPTIGAFLAGVQVPAEVLIRRCCERLGVELSDVLARGRKANVAHARAVCAWVLRRRGLSHSATAAMLGLKDHSTIIAAMRKINAERARSPESAAILDALWDDCNRQQTKHDLIGDPEFEGLRPCEGGSDFGHCEHGDRVTPCYPSGKAYGKA